MIMCKFTAIVALTLLVQPNNLFAGITSQAVKVMARKLAGEAAKDTAKKTAKYLATEAAEKSAKEATKAAVKRTASVATHHFGKVAATAPQFVDDFAKATAKMTPRNARRLQMLAPKLNESGQAVQVVSHLASGNADLLIESLWRHKEELGAAAVVTGLLIHGDDIVNASGEYVAKPVIENVVAPASRLLVSGVILTFLIGLVGLAAFLFGGEATERVTGNVRRLIGIFTTRA
jgi:hypothetical protein